MNSAFLLIPLLLLRFGLLALIDASAISRAAHFAPMNKKREFYYIYQFTNIGLVVFPFFLSFQWKISVVSILGGLFYLLGIFLLYLSIVAFAISKDGGLKTRGIYQFSRNPMYLAYYSFYLGLGLLSQSSSYCILLVIFVIAGHYIILAEEKWCVQEFGQDYEEYAKSVPRYLFRK